MRRTELAALARSASRSASLLAHRLAELARAIEFGDRNEISYIADTLGSEVERTDSLVENVEIEIGKRRGCRRERP